MWITNGGFADVFTIFAKVDGEKFTAFIVERGMGVTSGREEPKLGLDGSSTTALILENVPVPVENVLGQVGQGHKVAFNILNLGRLKLGTRNIGGAKQALTRAIRYATERRQFGQAIADFGLIKQKLAEMAVRCFVGDAMVYRTLGDVDRELAAIDETEIPSVLKAIEAFAVECSINKVWTSEALAYVVDEALQVYGGYGYSSEFPAERAYRDARITRIYEGTNEINRLIIATRLLKSLGRQGAADSGLTGVKDTSPFSDGRDLLRRAKQFVIAALCSAQQQFGEALSSEQEVLGHIADIAIEAYALESSILRAEKLGGRGNNGGREAAITADITRVYASDAADRMEHSARQIEAALAGGTPPFATAGRLATAVPYNTVAARRRIAGAILQAGRYYL
jgi:alkylation response protein AidB-like acyl-CoA dehydrogenase